MSGKPIQLPKALQVFNRVKNIVFVVIIFLIVAIIAMIMVVRLTGGTPSLFGFSLFRVSSGSMEPELKVGDIILVSSCDPLTLKEGDIVSYYGVADDVQGKLITHRVVKAPYKIGLDYYITTKGDVNSKEDSPIGIENIIGKYSIKVELLSAVYSFFITPWGLISLIALIIFAFFNEIVIFIRSLMGIGFEENSKKESVEQIIERYRKENHLPRNDALINGESVSADSDGVKTDNTEASDTDDYIFADSDND